MANRAQENKTIKLNNPETKGSTPSTGFEIPENAIELSVKGVSKGETPNGLPFQVIEAGDVTTLENGAEISEALYVCAPDELAEAQFDMPAIRETKMSKQALLAALAGAISLGACVKNYDSNSTGNAGDQAVEQMQQKMSLPSDIDNFGHEQEAIWTQPGDTQPNIGTFNGEVVVTFMRADHCYYVKAADIQTAMSSGTPQLLDLPGILQSGDPIVSTCAVSHQNGNKVYYSRGWETNFEADLSDVGGSLQASNPQTLPGSINEYEAVFIEEAGEGFLIINHLGNVGKYNIATGVVTPSSVDPICGLPHRDPETGIWVGSRFDNYTGPIACRVIKANTLEDLATSIQYVNNIMNNSGLTGDAINPRIHSQVMVFEGRNNNGGTLDDSKIYYAVVQPYCGDGNADPGETNANCPADVPAQQQDAGVPDAAPDATVEADSAVDGEVVTPDAATDAEVQQDAEPQTDAEVPDAGPTIPPECVPFVDKIDIVSGEENCDLVDCESNQNYEYATIEGQCTFEVQLGNPNPVQLTIDGAYSVDFLNKIGELLRGSYEVEDRGNEMGTTYANSVTGVTGTTYGGNEAVMENGNAGYHLYCDEGQVQLRINNELVATLNAGDSGTYDLENIVTEQPDKKCSTGGPGGKELALAGMLLFLAAGALRKRREEQTVEVPGAKLFRHIRDQIKGVIK